MNKWKAKLAKWLLHSDGFQFAAVKEKDGNIWIEGDIKVMRYLDTDGYFWNKSTLKRKL
jgi:hypothetical protein